MPKVNINGFGMHYELEGNGPPLVLIPGTGTHCHTWKIYQVPFFSKHFQVLIFDHRGIGYSDKPDVKYSTRLFADDLNELLNHLRIDKAHVLGHSMGGRVAQWLALEHPEKVKSLVLAATGPGKYRPEMEYPRGVPLSTALKLVDCRFEDFIKDHFSSGFWFNPEFKEKNPEEFEKIQRVFLEVMPEPKPYLRHVVARQEHELTDRVDKIKQPTLVIVGENDRVLGNGTDHVESSRFMAGKILGAQLVTIGKVRHGLFWEAHEETNSRILDFLRSH
ncbi:MAG: alpha/beta fold hydrolase [Thaumarchaeota archaeon]|nr:alpha/beta fold hydrolase [Nitrososphaerota archaeon]